MTIRTEKKGVPNKFPPARLYLDDLEEIASVFRDLVDLKAAKREPEANLQFTFRCAGKSCDDIQEVSKVLKPLREFSLQVGRGHDRATLNNDPWLGARWSAWSLSEPEQWGGFSRLEPIFQKRKRHWSALVHFKPALSFLAFSVAIYFMLPVGVLFYNRTNHALAVTAALLAAATLILVGLLGFLNTFVVPRHSWEPSPARRFLAEKAIGWILGPLLGALALYLLQMLIHRITQSP